MHIVNRNTHSVHFLIIWWQRKWAMRGKPLFYPIDIEVCTLHFRYIIAPAANTTALLQLIASGNRASTASQPIAQYICCPPLMEIFAPVTKAASSDAR